MENKNIIIGFIGQGFVGKNYADSFESRGYNIVRYSNENGYEKNKDNIKLCRIVFIAVPTPTVKDTYDLSIVRKVIGLTSPDTIVVLKSTMLPGSTKIIQEEFPDRIILHSPEFLSELTAFEDVSNPFANIIGIPEKTDRHIKSAQLVNSVLPGSKFNKIVTSDEAEFIKYTHNCAGFSRIIFFNLVYDLSQKFDVNWNVIKQALKEDPYITDNYSEPFHKSGRGAGGHCFIKDFAAFRMLYQDNVFDKFGLEVLKSMEEKNKDLLKRSGKDLDLLVGVYGQEINKKNESAVLVNVDDFND